MTREVMGQGLLPPRTRRPRQEGNPRPFWGFRPTEELRVWIEDYVARERLEKSGAVVYMLEMAADVMRELGPDWYEVERMGKVEGTSPGRVVARLIRAGLAQEKKTKK